jgi:hypothetical protein
MSVLGLTVSLVPCVRAQLVPNIWSGTADWTSSINWSLGLVPSTLHNALVSSGTATVSTTQSVGAITLSGTGVITGGGTLTLTGTGSVWSSGNMNNGGGSLIIQSGADLTISGSADHDFSTRNITNNGTIAWTGGRLRSGQGGTLVNNGAFNDSASSTVNTDFSGTSLTFTNAATGTYTKSASGTTRFDVAFNNSGAVNVNAGTLDLNGGGSQAAASSITVAANSILKFGGNHTVADAATLTGGGLFQLASGNLTLSGTFGGQLFEIAGGTLIGTHTLSAPGGATWTGGNMNAAGTTTIAATRTFTISSVVDHDFDGHAIVNNGITNWTAGRLRSGHSGGILNNGTFNDSASSAINNDFSGTTATFTNAATGTYNKTAAGTTTVSVLFTNSGALNVQAGTLRFDGTGSFSAAAPVAVSPGATLQINSTMTVADASVFTGAGAFSLTGGTLTLAGTFGASGGFSQTGGTLAGTHTFASPFAWSAGNWNASGTTTIAAANTLTISSAADHDFDFRTVTNNGTINWSAGRLRSGHLGGIVNNGIFNDSASSAINNDYSGTTATFTNAATGTYNKNAAGTTTLLVPFTNNGAVNVSAGTLRFDGTGSFSAAAPVAVSSGATLQINSTMAVVDASVFTGAGAFSLTGGTLTLAGAFGASGGFAQTGGTLAGTHTFTSPFAWSAGNGNASGTTTIAAANTLTISSGLDHDFDFRTITNNGTINWTGGRLRSGHLGGIVNNAVFNDSASSAINNDYSGTTSTFTNAATGTFNKNAAGTTTIAVPFTNNGAVNVNTGTLKLDGSGSFAAASPVAVSSGATLQINSTTSVADASVFTGAGTLSLTGGTLTLTGTFGASGGFSQSGGTLAGTHTFASPFAWSAGLWNASGTTTIAGSNTLTISTTADHDFDLRTISNNGTINWTGGRLRSGHGGGIVNNAVFNDSASSTVNNDYSGTTSTFTNAATGSYNKNAAAATVFSVPFTNNGAVNVNAGTLNFNAGGSANAGSVITVASGTTLHFSGGSTFSLADPSTLAGTGTVAISSGTTAFSSGTFTLPLLSVSSSGLLTGNATISTAALTQTGGSIFTTALNLIGNATWSSGNWGDHSLLTATTATIAPGTTLTISSSADHDFNRRIVTNNGTIEWTGGRLRSGSSGGIVNNALFNDSASSTINSDYGGTTATFTNAVTGTYNKNAAGTTTFSVPFTNAGAVNVNAGTLNFNAGGSANAGSVINVAAGTTLLFTGGSTFSLADPSTLAATGNVTVTSGTTAFSSGTFALPLLNVSSSGLLTGNATLSIAALTQTGGSILTTALNLTGNATWISGNWGDHSLLSAATATVAPGTTLTISSGADHDFNRRTITNNGTIEWTGGRVRSGNSGGIVNNALFNDSASSTINSDYGGTTATFTNAVTGTYNKNAAGTTTVSVPFTNNGTVNLNTGTLNFNAGGNANAGSVINVAAGTTLHFSGSSTFALANPSTLAATGNVTITSGTTAFSSGTFALPVLNVSSSGLLTGNSTLSTASLTQTGGSILTTALNLTGNATWTSGNWGDHSLLTPATATVSPGTTLTVSSGADHDFNRRTITNNGTIEWIGGRIRSGNNGGIVNNAIVNDSASSTINSDYGGTTATFTNAATGVFNKNAAGTTTVSVPFTNNGTVNLNTGTLNFNAGGNANAGSVITVAAGTTLLFSGSSTFSLADPSTLAATGTVTVTSGTTAFSSGTFTLPVLNVSSSGLLTGNVTLSTASLTQTGGSLFTTALNLTGNATWSSGSWGDHSVVAPTTATIAPAATLTISSGADHDFNRRTITNNGTMEWTAGRLRSGNLGGIVNNAVFNDSASSTINNDYGGTTSTFTNAATGTFNKNAVGTTTLSVPFTNSGTVNVNAGTLNFNAGGSATGGSIINVTSGTTLQFGTGSFTLPNAANVAFGGTAAATITGGNVTVTSGGFSPPSLVLSAGSLTASDVAAISTIPTLTITGGTLTTAGAVMTNLLTQSAGSIMAASLLINGNSAWTAGNWGDHSLLTATTATIAPTATLTISSGADHDFNRRTITNNGTINWTGGRLRSGNLGGIVNNALFNDSASSAINNDYGGTTSTFINTATGTYNKTAAGTTTVSVPFTNSGIVNVNAGTLNFNGGGSATTGSMITLASGTTLQFSNGNFTLTNAANVAFGGTASATVTGGNVTLTSGAFSPSSLTLSSGSLTASDIAATSTIPALTISGGTLTAAGAVMTNLLTQSSGSILAASLLINDNSTWSAGNWGDHSLLTAATATISPAATLTISSGADHDFNRRTITNNGTINWTGGRLRSGNAGGIVNNAIFNDSASTSINNDYGGTTSTFTNATTGTYNKLAAGTTTIFVPFTNNGALNVNAGVLRFTSSFTNSNGTISSTAGTTLQFDQGLTLSSGTLGGGGTIIGNVTASGVIAPGASAGQLTITGNLTLLSTASLLIELGGATQGSGYDFVSVSGIGTLGGNLGLSFLNGYQASVSNNDAFTVVTANGAASLSGAFTNVSNGQRIFTSDGFGSFQVNYGVSSALATNSVVLSSFVAVPEPSTWALLAVGGLLVAFTVRQRSRR